MIQELLIFLERLSQEISLPLFSFIGAVASEFFPLVPSSFVAITFGSLVFEQEQTLAYLFFLVFIGAASKTASTVVTYWIADKFEDYLTHSTLGKVLGFDENEVEKYGRYLDGTRKDTIIMLILRSLPIIPTLPVSLLAGLVKINLWTYIWTTFVGIYISLSFFAILAYEGVRHNDGIFEILSKTGTLVTFIIVMMFSAGLFLFFRKRWEKVVDFILRRKPPEEIIKEAKKDKTLI